MFRNFLLQKKTVNVHLLFNRFSFFPYLQHQFSLYSNELMSTQPLRKQDVTPYFTMDNCKEAHDWYVKYFDAKIGEINTPTWDANDKRYLHSALELPNKAIIFMSDRFEMEHGSDKAAKKLTKEQLMTVPVTTHLTFKCPEEAQKFWDKATSEGNGSKAVMKFEKQFWGDLYGKFYDTFGFEWSVSATPMEECQAKGKKRTLADSKSSDTKDGHEEHSTPNSKKKKPSATSTNSEALHSGFLGIVECDEKVGVFQEFRVGKGTGYDFGKAFQEGLKTLQKVKSSCGKHVEWREMVSVCPEDPKKIAIVRYLPGMLSNKSAEELKELVKDFNDVTVVTLPAGKYYVYSHIGSYQGLVQAWTEAVSEFEKKGYKFISSEACFEEYTNCMPAVPENKLQTKIYLGIAE